ncbi:sigma-54-dependent transcriptional regulator [Desulfomicrobium baculatum]|uniref:Two component, sigma54 specific, transcriptional regulator, Fis family n=1 Tax=Desulfomicrobium baculatum (strain DSM 4028 / VKM B-1378 / X) TaxID=525897 RepID=C7LWP1_DESBD|nr:two component, sigma54 specific, transcriptional regulator, Fis family [Desulfomicrobium baculatum DSM 4028]
MHDNASILIIDDEKDIRLSLRGIFEDENWQVTEAGTGTEGLGLALDGDFDLIFLDIWMPGMDGMAVLCSLREKGVDTPVIMISGHGNIETAVTALKNGAFDFIEKPLSLDNILVTAGKALELSRLKRENRELRSRIQPEETPTITGSSLGIVRLRELVAQVGPTEAWVLITGENGTGKEIAARAIHRASKRADREMVCVNCAAIPEELIEAELFGHEKGAFTGADKAKKGKFELADKSTLFLDEIADMSLKTQAKILRILQEQKFERVGGVKTFKVDVRVIAATNKDLVQEMVEGRFRQDLYYRLNVFPLCVPPLRERAEDIPEMIEFFSRRMIEEQSLRPVRFDRESLDLLKRYAWPGNVRELKNFVERLFILYQGQEVNVSMLPPEYRTGAALDALAVVPDGITDFKEARARFEEAFLRRELARADGNVARLSETIGLERTYLYRKLRTYGIGSEEGR